MSKTLQKEEADLLIKIFRKYFLNVYKMIYILDQKQADYFKDKNTYFYEEYQKKNKKKHNHSHEEQKQGCCSSFFAKVYIPEKERSGLEQIICEQFSPLKLRDHIPTLLEFLQTKFDRIKQSGQKDKLTWDQQTEVYVLNEVMREGVQFYFQKEIKKIMQQEQYIDSKQPLLLATPITWTNKHPKIPLNFLRGETIESLMRKGFGIQLPFINILDFPRNLYHEMDYLERDGRFEQPLLEQSIREDKTFWLTLKDMDQKNFKNLYSIAHTLSALPYEFNAKTQILAQISESFQLSFFNDKRKMHLKHLDSSFEKGKDTGKKVSIFYIVFDPDDEKPDESNNMTLYNENEKSTIMLESDMLILLMSRKIAYEIQGNGKKMFIIRFWIDGPYEDRTNY